MNSLVPSSVNCENSTETSTSSCASNACAVLEAPNLKWADKLAILTYRFSKLDQSPTPVEHHFEKGLYIRTIRIPADTLFLGRVHTVGHKCELVSGRVMHITEHERRIVEAPFSMVTTPGYQMVLYAFTDVIGRTVHLNEEESRDMAALERDFAEPASALWERGRDLDQRLIT